MSYERCSATKVGKVKKKISAKTVIIAALVLAMASSVLFLSRNGNDGEKIRKSPVETKSNNSDAAEADTENTVFGGILPGGEKTDYEKFQDPNDWFCGEEEDDGISIGLSMPDVIENGYAERVIAVIHSAYKPKSLIVQIDDGEETIYNKISKKYKKSYEIRDVRIKLDKEYEKGDFVKIKMTVTFTGREDYVCTEEYEIGDAE